MRRVSTGGVPVIVAAAVTVAVATLAAGQEIPREAQRQPRRQAPRQAQAQTQPRGLVRNEPGAYPGYTLFSSLGSFGTYLVDMDGVVVHQWNGELRPNQGVYLLESGNLLRCARDPANPIFGAGGDGGFVQEIAWDGTVAWELRYSDREKMQHHDVERLPNGSVLLIAWELRTRQEALAAGRDPEAVPAQGMWPLQVAEVRPIRPKGAEVVWMWHVWDHLIQDRDPDKLGFGDVAAHPELVDVNGDRSHEALSDEERAQLEALGYIQPPRRGGQRGRREDMGADWLHTNAIDYNAELDQIVLSVHNFSEIWVIDHSTTTAEAAGHRGGKSGRGGDLLYRWGNPQTYRAGDAASQQFFEQHDAQWIAKGLPGAGNLMVFNNGRRRPGEIGSSVDEIRPPLTWRKKYRLEKVGGFGPAEPLWSYKGSGAESFFAGHLSGAQRLPNGDTLVCDGENGRIFEVTRAGKIVWEYLSPFRAERAPARGLRPRPGRGRPGAMETFGTSRATRLPADYPGLARLH